MKKMFEVIYKYLTIVFLIISLLLLSFTAYEFYTDSISVKNIFVHKLSGLALLIVTFIHILIKRKKLKKLTLEFFNIFSSKKKVTLDGDMDRLLNSLEPKTLEQIAALFDIEYKELKELLLKNKIMVEKKQQTLKDISKINSYKTFAIIVKIIEYKLAK